MKEKVKKYKKQIIAAVVSIVLIAFVVIALGFSLSRDRNTNDTKDVTATPSVNKTTEETTSVDQMAETNTKETKTAKKEESESESDVKKETSVKKNTENKKAANNKKRTTEEVKEANDRAEKTSNVSSNAKVESKEPSNTSNNTSSSSNKSVSDTTGKTAKVEEKPAQKSVTKAENTTSGAGTCTHTWVWATKTIHHDAVTETYEVCPAWDEEITETHTVCNGCGFDFTANGYSNEQLLDHSCNASYRTATVVVGTIHHDAEYGTGTTPAWDEVVNDYQYCSKCGARK